MRIGIGLPNTIPGVQGRTLVEWAKQAEAAGFSTLSTIGRVIFPTHDEFIALTAAAAVTERIKLFSNVTVEPLFDPVILARQAASLDQISQGRFTLGVGVGWNPNDFAVVGKGFTNRGCVSGSSSATAISTRDSSVCTQALLHPRPRRDVRI